MTNMLEDGVALMVGSLLASAGSTWTYARGSSSASITLYHSRLESEQLDVSGAISKTIQHDFMAKTMDLPYGNPQQGDVIYNATEKYEVNSRGMEYPWRVRANGMIRIFTIQAKR